MNKAQYFRPKDKGVLERAKSTNNVHPTLEDIKEMARDTIRDAAGQIKQQEKKISDAEKTITEVEKEKKNGSD